ncbi:MAG: LamG domain-containing protein [Verrucomicrobiota bacterium]
MKLSATYTALYLVFGICVLPQAKASLILYLNFDNSSDVGQSAVGDDLNAVGDAAHSTTAKIGGGSLSLDGSGDYLRRDSSDSVVTGLPTGDSSYTLSAWIRSTNSGTANGIIGWGDYGTGGEVNAFRTGNANPTQNGLLNYGWGPGFDYAASADPYDGLWHHVVATYDSASSTKRLYFDGAEIGSGMVIPNLSVASSNFRIGSTNSGEFFNGMIDDLGVYDHALSSGSIQSI